MGACNRCRYTCGPLTSCLRRVALKGSIAGAIEDCAFLEKNGPFAQTTTAVGGKEEGNNIYCSVFETCLETKLAVFNNVSSRAGILGAINKKLSLVR